MKLRLLNGSHSTLAYLGYRAGYETLADTMRCDYRALAEGVMDAAATTLKMPPGTDVAAYKRALIARYANPALKHRTWQICWTARRNCRNACSAPSATVSPPVRPSARWRWGVAGWMRYVTGVDEHGKAIDVRDPLSARLRAIADTAGLVAGRLAPSLLDVREIFGGSLRRMCGFGWR